MIVLWLLRRILSRTPLVWKTRGLDESGISLWKRFTLLRLRRDHCLAKYGAQRKPLKKLLNRIFFAFRVWESGRDRCSVQSFSFKVCFIGLWIKNDEGETEIPQVQKSNAVLAILKYALISANESVLSEMEGNLSLSLSFFLSSLVTRQWGLPSLILEK